MRITTRDKRGIGNVNGVFVRVAIAEYGLDCGLYIGEICDSGVIEAPLITDLNNNVEFDLTSRDILYDKCEDEVALLSKDDVLRIIESLQRAYIGMI